VEDNVKQFAKVKEELSPRLTLCLCLKNFEYQNVKNIEIRHSPCFRSEVQRHFYCPLQTHDLW